MKNSPWFISHSPRSCLMLWAAAAPMLFATPTIPTACAQAPHVSMVTPADGATGVDLNASLVFVFDKPMDQTVFIVTVNSPPVLVGNLLVTPASLYLTGLWSQDGLTLTCPAVAALPADTTVSWTLNPAGTSYPLTDESGTPLATVSGSFTTAGSGGGGCDPDGVPDTWGNYSVYKSGHFVQTSSADPVPISKGPFTLGAYVKGPDAGPAVESASLVLPGGATSNLMEIPFTGSYTFGDYRDTEAELDMDYPPGTYTLHFMQTGEPERIVPVDLPAGGPPVPKILNFDATQSVNAGEDFTLEWNEFTNAGTGDFISLNIADGNGVVFQAPDLCVPRDLQPTDTSIVVPASTLQSNQTYEVTLAFQHSTYYSTNDFPDMSGFGGIYRSTQFTIKTGTGGSGPAEGGRWTAYRLLLNGNPELDFEGTPFGVYTVERASEPNAVSWAPVGFLILDASGKGVFEDTLPDKVFPLFYRTSTSSSN